MDIQQFYKDESIIEFNELSPLINVPFSSGFRVITKKVSYDDMLNYLSDTYGEGILIGNAIHNSKWILKQKKDFVTLFIILINKEMVDDIIHKFNLELTIDSSYTVEVKVKKLLSPFISSNYDRKTIRKIKCLVSKEFNIRVKDIDFNCEDNIIRLTINNTQTKVCL